MSDRPREDERLRRLGWVATIGIAAIPVLVPVFEGRINVGPLPLDAVIVSVLVALIASFPYVRARGVAALPASGLAIPVALFLGVAAVGTAYHGSPATIMTWLRYASYFALVPVVGLVAASPARRRALLWMVVAGGSLTLVHATYQYLNPGTTQAIGMTGLVETVSTRVYSTFENPNFYAEYLLLVFAAAFALTLTERRLLRLASVGACGFAGVVLLLTYTRGSWIALALGVGLTVAIVNWRLLLPLSAGAVMAVLAVPGVASRLLSLASTEGTASFRMRLWRIAGEVLANHPFLGVGLGNFYEGFKEVALSNPGLGVGYAFYGAHNSYFQVAAETGVIGGLAFTLAVLAVCRAGLAFAVANYDAPRDRLMAAALLAGVVAFSFNALTSNAFQHPRGAVFFFLLAGVSAGIGSAGVQRPVAPRTPGPSPVLAHSVAVHVGYALVNVVAGSAAWRYLTSVPQPRLRLFTSSRVVRAVFGPDRNGSHVSHT